MEEHQSLRHFTDGATREQLIEMVNVGLTFAYYVDDVIDQLNDLARDHLLNVAPEAYDELTGRILYKLSGAFMDVRADLTQIGQGYTVVLDKGGPRYARKDR